VIRILFFLLLAGCANQSIQPSKNNHPLTTISQLISQHGQVQSYEIQSKIDSITQKLKQCTKDFKVIVLNTETINAYAADESIVIISLPLYKIANNDDELAFIIAHELAHLILHSKIPPSDIDPNQRQKIESEADQLAVSIMTKSGFDSNNGIQVLLSENFSSCQHSVGSYLPAKQRYFNLLR
jgi:predicted Zn-dependent protease